MRRWLVCSVVVTAILIPFGIFAGGLGTKQAGEFELGSFSEPRTCGMCHPRQLAEWEGSMHSLSASDFFYRKVVELAAAEVPGIEEFCGSCHSPLGILTGQDHLDWENLDQAGRSGVSCDFCHTVEMATGIGNSAYHVNPGELKYGPFGSDPGMFHTVEKNDLQDSHEFCGMCHDVSHPLNGLPLETTYSEFLAGPYPERGFKCQSCHMTPGITGFQANPGTSANLAEEREHVWDHSIFGGNAWITEQMGHLDHGELARKRLSMAAEVEFSNAFPLPDGTEFTFAVVVSNVGAGHKIPTGVTEERQIWLEVVAFDQEGNELAHFGELDEHGVISEDTMILGTVFGDAEGQPTHKLWAAESVLFDRRIAPEDSDLEAYSIPLAPGMSVARIEAQLWYRSSHQDFVDELFADAEERVLVPVIPMAQAVWVAE